MKVLYAIQGTGNGHLSRAREIIPALQKHCLLDIMVSGTQSQVVLPFPVTYRCKGLSFAYNNRGGISYQNSLKGNISLSFFKEVRNFPIGNYDLIINDFEPISAWAAKLKKVPCLSMSHQAAFMSEKAPRPEKKEILGEGILRHYAPAEKAIGFHFERYDNFIETPVIRSEIRNSEPVSLGHYTVYLPAISEEKLLKILNQIPQVEWQVFSRYTRRKYTLGNIQISPVNNDDFVKSLITCEGLFTGAGFEAPSEAIYLGKKLFVIPIKGQYEQMCNAAALEKVGIRVAYKLNYQTLLQLTDWVCGDERAELEFPDQTDKIAGGIFTSYHHHYEREALLTE